ncbi:type 1 glutamine amidotransferase [Nonomuraea sp. NPDC050328]|uniref:type 1 glutamine amidotransferase n=1 Tax=Nonomuraea sp. NPDC050328 TaxID=3364361 RepID=UPI003795A03A
MRMTVIEHEAGAGLGYLADWLGLPCDVVRPYLGEPVPERAADGLIVLGGEAAAWEDDDHPWLPATRDLLRASVEHRVPTLGICLGAQLLTLACGGTVERGAAGLEVGACAVTALPAAEHDVLFHGIGTAVAIQYHRDAMTRLPEGAVPLLTGTQYPNQCYRLGDSAWAVQFHPEATPAIFASWTAASGVQGLDEAVAAAEPGLIAAWRPVAERFAALVKTRATVG